MPKIKKKSGKRIIAGSEAIREGLIEVAKKNKNGLWSMNFEFPWDYRKKN